MISNIFEYSSWIPITSPDVLSDTMTEMLSKCHFNILNFIDHKFNPYGYTAVWLLSESHLAVHSFPEKNRSYVQLSSCNREKFEMFISLLKPIKVNLH
ncbi:MAG: S-adenosylmethionine decarboxylase [Chitinispirillia bacterium]|jgi:S-adenosylmethionine/arginine decarboxylase-like enzyme